MTLWPRKRVSFSDEVVDQKLLGNDVEVIARPKRMKKYRSLASIYKVTTPITVHSIKEKKVK